MMKLCTLCAATVLLSSVYARTLWDGRFNSYSTGADLDRWSWSNQVGEYQAYIFGAGKKVSDYVTLDQRFCAPIDPSCSKGARFIIDGSSRWNGQTMLRTELIPQNQPNYQGKRFFRFSMKMDPQNPLNSLHEHQLVFWESHFCDIKFGVPFGQSSSHPLRNSWQFYSGNQLRWSAPVTNDWFNFAWEIDFNSGTVGLWQSINGEPLRKVADDVPVGAAPSDFHVGILRLQLNGQQDPATTGVWYSNVFIEDSLSASTGSAPAPTRSPTQQPATRSPTQAPTQQPATRSPTQAPTRPPTQAPTRSPTQAPTGGSGCNGQSGVWQQCGGRNYGGPTCCTSGTSCIFVNEWYSQCIPGNNGRSLEEESQTSTASSFVIGMAVGASLFVAVGGVIAALYVRRHRQSQINTSLLL